MVDIDKESAAMADAAPAVAGWTADIEAVRAIAPAAVEGEGGQGKITREELLMLKKVAEEGAGLASPLFLFESK